MACACARAFLPDLARLQPWIGLLIAATAASCQPIEGEVFTDQASPPVVVMTGAGGQAEASGGAGKGAPAVAGRAGTASQRDAGGGGQPVITAPPDPPPDPKIHFDWTETAPNRGPCGPGTFTGFFSCEVSSPLFLLLYTHVEGSLEMTFSGSSEAPQINITMGELRASDNTAREFLDAPVVGDLNCGTRVVDAELLRTVTAVLPLDRQLFWLLPYQQPSTTGWLRGNLDPLGKVINGDLSLSFETQTYCIGTFAVTSGP